MTKIDYHFTGPPNLVYCDSKSKVKLKAEGTVIIFLDFHRLNYKISKSLLLSGRKTVGSVRNFCWWHLLFAEVRIHVSKYGKKNYANFNVYVLGSSATLLFCGASFLVLLWDGLDLMYFHGFIFGCKYEIRSYFWWWMTDDCQIKSAWSWACVLEWKFSHRNS